jgi:hypothetical protein
METRVVLYALGLACLLPASSAGQQGPSEPAAAQEEPAAPSSGEAAELWIGKTADELIAKWGEPSRTKRLKGGEQLLVYKIVVSGDARPTNDARIPISSPVPAGFPTSDSGDRRDGGNFEDGRFWIDTKGDVEAPVKDKLKVRFRIDAQGKVADVEVSSSRSTKGRGAK